jgi:hypothetical protein
MKAASALVVLALAGSPPIAVVDRSYAITL